MQTWAQRGLRTALVTGGLLMLGTGIANASQHVPVTPIDAGGLPGAGSLPAPLGKEETDALHNTLDTVPGDAMTNVDRGAVAGDVATPTRLEHVLAAANRFRHSAGFRPADEWGALTGDLAQLPAHNVYRVPVDVVGRAVDSRYAAVPVADGDTAPRLDPPFGEQAGFGPSDDVDGLLGANQVPRIGDLFRAHPMPVADMAYTQVFPVLSDGVPAVSSLPRMAPVPPISPAELTQRLPVIPARPVTPRNTPYPPQPRNTPYDPQPRYEPMSGELPVTGSLPNMPGTSTPVAAANLPTVSHPTAPNLSTLPDLPPVPTLPAMPPLPGRPGTQAMPAPPVLPHPQVNAPSLPPMPALPRLTGPATGGLPALAPQDMPAGSAQQLMAQLRGLISDLEQGRQMHPMGGAELTTLLPRITDDGPVPPIR